MTKGYVVITEAIDDPAGMTEYSRAAGPTLAEHGARVLVAGKPEVLEGAWHGQQTVIVEFDSPEAARAWYDSAGYTAARAMRQRSADCNGVLLTGFEPGNR